MKMALFLRCMWLPVLIGACDQVPQSEPGVEQPQWEISNPSSPIVPQEPALTSPAHTRAPSREPKILPLTLILEIVRRDTPGEILEVEEDDDDDIPTYEVQVLTPDDRKIEIKLNAYTGAIIERDEN